jgi:excisionase family DNA binding protein
MAGVRRLSMADEATPANEDDEEELKTYAWLRRRTGLPPGTLYALVHDGRIPHVRLGKRLVRFRKRDIDHWLKERTVPANP